jgi:hypothetical protein
MPHMMGQTHAYPSAQLVRASSFIAACCCLQEHRYFMGARSNPSSTGSAQAGADVPPSSSSSSSSAQPASASIPAAAASHPAAGPTFVDRVSAQYEGQVQLQGSSPAFWLHWALELVSYGHAPHSAAVSGHDCWGLQVSPLLPWNTVPGVHWAICDDLVWTPRSGVPLRVRLCSSVHALDLGDKACVHAWHNASLGAARMLRVMWVQNSGAAACTWCSQERSAAVAVLQRGVQHLTRPAPNDSPAADALPLLPLLLGLTARAAPFSPALAQLQQQCTQLLLAGEGRGGLHHGAVYQLVLALVSTHTKWQDQVDALQLGEWGT